MTFIYGLYSVNTTNQINTSDENYISEIKIRYVGKTVRPKKRLKQHISESKHHKKSTKQNWISDELNKGNDIKIKILEVCYDSIWREREIFWIDKLPNLTNTAKGGGSYGGVPNVNFLTYEDASCIVRWLGITSNKQFINYFKEHPLTVMPVRVNDHYKIMNTWTTFGIFFGTNRVQDNIKALNHLSYEKAEQWVHENLNIETSKQWYQLVKLNKIPTNISTRPNCFYKNRGWISWSTFLKSRFISNVVKHNNYISFDDAKKIVLTLNIKSISDWNKRFMNEIEKLHIPSLPQNIYKEFVTFDDFFGTNNKNPKNPKNYLNYEDAKKWVKENLPVKTSTEWRQLNKQHTIPDFIPNRPDSHYVNFSWIDFLDNINKPKRFYTYEKAKEYIKNNFIINDYLEYKEVSRKFDFPKFLPHNPHVYYKDKEMWYGWNDYLSIDNVVKKIKIKYDSYENTKLYIQTYFNLNMKKEFYNLYNSGMLPKWFPPYPDSYYKQNNTWESWNIFLNAKKIEKYLSYNNAKIYIKNNYNIYTCEEYHKISNEPNFPKKLPKNPDKVYSKTGEWLGWKEFICNTKEIFMNYNECKTYIKKFNINSSRDFYIKIKTMNNSSIPKRPDIYYTKLGTWYSWNNFLSK